jgi:glycosyltransferase involved in cell wall biosynthesis
MTLVSVIMPVWKPRADWLCEAVASVLADEACDIELIIIDDGNDVPLSEALSDVDDPRLRLIRLDHCGHYAARNAGLNAARGDYVRFFDADDVVVPGSTARLLAAAQAAGDDTVAYGWTMMCDEQLTPYRLVSCDYEGHVADDFLLGRFDVYIHGMLCPKNVLDRVGPWNEKDYRLMGDRDFVQRVLEQAPLCGLGEVVTLYRRNSASVTRSFRSADAVQAGLQVLKGYFDRYPEKRGTDLYRSAYRNLHLYRARQFYTLGETGASVRQLILAARHDPVAVTSLALGLIGKRIARLGR